VVGKSQGRLKRGVSHGYLRCCRKVGTFDPAHN